MLASQINLLWIPNFTEWSVGGGEQGLMELGGEGRGRIVHPPKKSVL